MQVVLPDGELQCYFLSLTGQCLNHLLHHRNATALRQHSDICVAERLQSNISKAKSGRGEALRHHDYNTL